MEILLARLVTLDVTLEWVKAGSGAPGTAPGPQQHRGCRWGYLYNLRFSAVLNRMFSISVTAECCPHCFHSQVIWNLIIKIIIIICKCL